MTGRLRNKHPEAQAAKTPALESESQQKRDTLARHIRQAVKRSILRDMKCNASEIKESEPSESG